MAGAGYKLFNTGDVLTAAQVNTYLMQQTVMVFASSAARTSALSGVLAEGMVSYLQDTNTLEVYDGSAWVGATGDITGLTAGTGISISSATGPVPTITSDVATTFDAKGDLVVGTGADTFSKLTAGQNGESIVADSSTSTGLRWQGNYAAGKNAFINGDFFINQRGFTSNTTTDLYNFDRWQTVNSDGTVTCTPQTFTPGTAPVAGYEGKNFLRIVTTGQTATSARANLTQKIESVRSFAGQTVIVSFYAKANSATPAISVEAFQNFGSGGSPSASVSGSVASGTVVKKTISTSWARYSAILTIPSISGKTLGTTNDGFLAINFWISGGSDFNTRTDSIGIQTNTFDLWGLQVEAGSVATAFQTATGTLAGEFAAACRYYQVIGGTTNSYPLLGGYSVSGTDIRVPSPFPVQMRTSPTITKNGTWEAVNVGQPSAVYISEKGFSYQLTSTTTGTWYTHPNSTDDSFTISAEL